MAGNKIVFYVDDLIIYSYMNSGPGKCATTAVSELAKSYCYGTRGKILESNDIQSFILFNCDESEMF